MLRELVEYATQVAQDGTPNTTPPGYRVFTEPIKWFLEVNKDGIGRIMEGAGTPARPSLKRTSGIAPLLLVDESAYVLGVGEQSERTKQSFESFWSLMKEAQAATSSTELAQILRVLDHWPPSDLERVRPKETVGVKATGQPIPLQDVTIQSFWLAHSSREALSDVQGQCGICGQTRPLLRFLPFGVKGFKEDVQIISFNLDAFKSFGKDQGLNAPTCFDCGSKAASALSYLLRENSPNKVILSKGEGLDKLTAVFWSKAQMAEAEGIGQFDILSALKAPMGKFQGRSAEEPQDLGRVRLLLKIPWKAKTAALLVRPDAFYMLILSNNVSRLVVREWIHESLEDAKHNLGRFLDASLMVGPYGETPWPETVRSMLDALESDNPDLARILLETAYSGRAIPATMRVLAAVRLRNPKLWKEPKEHWKIHALLSFIRMQRIMGERASPAHDPSPELDPRKADSPYLCGRLLAVLERAQGIASSWSVGASVVDRTFGAAASAPKITFPPLIKVAVKAHLPSAGQSTRAAMDEVMASLDSAGGFPTTLNLDQQADFALGFYHQRAAFRAASKGRSETNNDQEEKK